MSDDFNMNDNPATDDMIVDDEVIGNVEQAKEVSVLVPPTKRVKFFIKDVKNYSVDKNNKPRDWKFLSLELYIENGIEIDGKIQYRNKAMYQNLPYFANPEKYDFENSDFFKNYAYLVPLQHFAKALEIDIKSITPKKVIETAKGKFVYADIVQVAETVKAIDPETGKMKRTKTGDFLNEVKNFQKVDPSELT